MERYSEVVGLPVLDAETGKKIGDVRDVLFCFNTHEVTALVLDIKGCHFVKKVIELADIEHLGRDALIIRNAQHITDLKAVEQRTGLKSNSKFTGLKIFTQTGDVLGTVTDVLFDSRTGKLEGVEFSDGLLQDIMQGRNILPLFGRYEISEESLLVSREAVEEMTNTGGGLKNKMMDK